METLVFVLMGLVCFNYLLKQSNRPLYAVAVSAVVCAAFVYALWPYAIEQSKSQVRAWLSDSALMRTMLSAHWLPIILVVEMSTNLMFSGMTMWVVTSLFT